MILHLETVLQPIATEGNAINVPRRKRIGEGLNQCVNSLYISAFRPGTGWCRKEKCNGNDG